MLIEKGGDRGVDRRIDVEIWVVWGRRASLDRAANEVSRIRYPGEVIHRLLTGYPGRVIHRLLT